MSTLNQIKFSILDNLTNTNITEELVAYHVKNVRAQLAYQYIGKYGVLPNTWVQSLGCLTIAQADKSECCEYPTGCVILKTNLEIPMMIDGSTSLLTRVGPVDMTQRPYQNIEFERVPFEGSNKYTKGLIKWFMTNNSNRIYLLMNMDDYLLAGLEVIQAQGVFEDPEALSSFTNCATGNSCFSGDSKYPMPDSMTPTLIEMVIKKFVAPQSQAPIDGSNDNKENPQTVVSKGE